MRQRDRNTERGTDRQTDGEAEKERERERPDLAGVNFRGLTCNLLCRSQNPTR